MKPVIIFDLDETLINSRHRTPRNADGTVNLSHYMANHNATNVFKDTLLPLARIAKAIKKTHYVIFCTARDMMPCDYAFLIAHDLMANTILSRNRASEAHYKCSDAEYKTRWIRPLRNLKQFKNRLFVMFDDEARVIRAMRSLGIVCYNAHSINARLTKGN
jgi:FMN phosphatase YigB (HAD superfamily)